MVKQCKWLFFLKVHVRSHWEHGENCLCCGYWFDSAVQLPLELQFVDHFPDKSPDTFFLFDLFGFCGSDDRICGMSFVVHVVN